MTIQTKKLLQQWLLFIFALLFIWAYHCFAPWYIELIDYLIAPSLYLVVSPVVLGIIALYFVRTMEKVDIKKINKVFRIIAWGYVITLLLLFLQGVCTEFFVSFSEFGFGFIENLQFTSAKIFSIWYPFDLEYGLWNDIKDSAVYFPYLISILLLYRSIQINKSLDKR